MNAIALGPFLLSLPRLYAFICALVLMLAARWLLKRSNHEQQRWFTGLMLTWLVSARLGHVLLNIDSYAGAPLDALMVWKPGYEGVFGLLGGIAWSVWTLRRHLRDMIVAILMLIGASGLWLALVAFSPLGGSLSSQPIPELTLEDIEGNDVYLPSLADGEHRVIINLWATWCPPCLREMPLLAEVATHEDVHVVVANQGEDLLPVVRYLDEQSLTFRYALRDPSQQLMVAFETPGLPTTLLFDRQGRMVEQHVGELTRAQLDQWLEN